MTHDTETFVQEVDEKLRQERMLAMARRFGPWLIGAFLAFILAIGGWQLWHAYVINEARTHSETFAAAQELVRERDFEQAKTAFDGLREQGPRAYRVMAQLEYAGVLTEQGDLDAALAAFDAAAASANDPTVRQTAQMRAAYIVAETQDFEALQQRLRPLIESDSRISFLARELLAIEAWEAGQNDLSRTTFEALSLAFDAPETVRQRAQVALSVLGPAPAGAVEAPSEGESK